jgi:hypothetical protein
MPPHETNAEAAATLALGALGWLLADPERARRFLDITGITPDSLRARANTPAFLAAVIAYLENHEPDLIACAETLQAAPEELTRARRVLEQR